MPGHGESTPIRPLPGSPNQTGRLPRVALRFTRGYSGFDPVGVFGASGRRFGSLSLIHPVFWHKCEKLMNFYPQILSENQKKKLLTHDPLNRYT